MAEEKEGVATGTAEAGNTEEGVLDTAVKMARDQQEDKVAYKVLEEENLPGARRKVVVEIDQAEWANRLDKLFKDLQKQATVEGFRKGKAPMNLLQRRYYEGATAELAERIAPMVVREYEQSKALTIYGTPSMTDIKAERGKPAVITLELEIKPEIEPKDYTGLEVEVPETKLPDDAVDKYLVDLAKENTSWEAVEREVAEDDAATVDWQTVDAKGHTTHNETDEMLYNLKTALPDALLSAVVGKKAGDIIEVEDNGLRHTLTIKGVKERRVPEVNDDFAKDTGFDDLAALRADAETKLKKFVDQTNEDEAFERLTMKLVEAHEFDVPSALHQHVSREMARSDYMYLQRTGATPPRLAGVNTRQDYETELNKASLLRVKGFLLMDAIGKKENLAAEEADIEAALQEAAEEQGRKPVAIRAALEKRKEWGQFVEQVRFDKIRKHLLEKTKLKYVEKKEEEEEPAAEATEEETPAPAAE